MCFLIHTEPLDLWYALVNWSCERHISVNYLHVSILLFFLYIYIFIFSPRICLCANVRK